MVDKRLEKMNASGEGKKLYIHLSQLKQKHLYHLYFMHTLILIFFSIL